MNYDDLAIAKEIAEESPHLSLGEFVDQLERRLDLDRFDYEEGFEELMQVSIACYEAYRQAGGIVQFPPTRE